MTRTRVVPPGPVALSGRAWSSRAPIAAVEVTADGGATWQPATLDPETGHRWAWRRWHASWTATAGRHSLGARATDADGNTQPVEQPWNRVGFANNRVQRVPVVCIDPGASPG